MEQVSKALLGADSGFLQSCSSVQEYHHSVKTVNFGDGRTSLDGKTVLVEKVESRPFVELTIRCEGFVPKAKNESLPIHFCHILEMPYSVQGTTE